MSTFIRFTFHFSDRDVPRFHPHTRGSAAFVTDECVRVCVWAEGGHGRRYGFHRGGRSKVNHQRRQNKQAAPGSGFSKHVRRVAPAVFSMLEASAALVWLFYSRSQKLILYSFLKRFQRSSSRAHRGPQPCWSSRKVFVQENSWIMETTCYQDRQNRKTQSSLTVWSRVFISWR